MASYVTPLHFNTVQPGLYRGSYPRSINFPLLKTLRLKTVVSLTPQPLDAEVTALCNEQGIAMVHIECNDKAPKDKTKKVKRKKKPVPIDYEVVMRAITVLANRNHYPVYIHCKNGELVTSLVVACLRKLTYWSTVSLLNEFLVYNSSINVHERDFIENFDINVTIEGLQPEDKVSWLNARFVSPAGNVNTKVNKGKALDSDQDHNTPANGISGSTDSSELPRLKFHSL